MATTMMAQRAGAPAREFRRFGVAAIDVRAKGATTEIDVQGYASVTGEPYTVTDVFGDFQETIEAGAFKRTLGNQDDVRLLFNHEGMPLARTKAGTLTLAEDKTGLKVDATLDTRSATSNDLVIAMQRGDVDEMSFAFKVTRQEWNGDYTERWIREVQLFDVSAVTYPANPATSIKLRAAEFLVNNCSAREAEKFIRAHQKAHVRTQVVVVDTGDDDEGDDDVLTCPSCGEGNEADAVFCDQCGASMDAAAAKSTNTGKPRSLERARGSLRAQLAHRCG